MGDVALAYLNGAATPHEGGTQPANPDELQDIMLLVKTPEGWRVDPISFGFA